MTRLGLLVLCLVAGGWGAELPLEEAAGRDETVTYEGAQLLRITAPTKKLKDEILKLEDVGDLEMWSGLARNNSNVDVLVKPDSEFKVKEFLNSHNLTFEVVIENLQRAIEAENPVLSNEEIDEFEGRKGHRMTWQQYHRLSDIHGYIDYLGQTFPELCSVKTIGNSVEGRPLKLLTISSGKQGARAIWIDGGVHAREWISPASVTYIINELVENRETHGEAIQAVDFHILAVANPDGYEHSHTKNRLWRKNRGNKNSPCGGIDLNRNFGYKWGGPGSSKQPCKETYAGTGQFSEPETQAISAFVLGRASSLSNELKEKESLLDPSVPLSGRRTTVAEASEKEALKDKLKDKENTIHKLTAEIKTLKDDKENIENSIDDLKSSNARLASEIGDYKEMLTNAKAKTISAAVTKLEKELEKQKLDSSMKDVEIRSLNHDLKDVTDSFERKKLAMMAAIADGRKKIEALEGKMRELQAALEGERTMTNETHSEREHDKKKLQDLTKQVNELEQALVKRQAPERAVAVDDVQFLENRIRQLEAELEATKSELEEGIKKIQDKFVAIKEKYDHNTDALSGELETWKREAALWKDASDVVKQRPESDAKKATRKPAHPLIGNAVAVKEDSRLVAEIRGLNQELGARDKALRAAERRLDDAHRTNKRLQAERERLLAQLGNNKGAPKGNKNRAEDKPQVVERDIELELVISRMREVNASQEEQLRLLTVRLKEANERRLLDLEQMQDEHNAEMADLAAESSATSRLGGDLHGDLRAQLHAQEQVNRHLGDKLKQLDEYRAEIMVLKVEREHLEKTLRETNKKLAFVRQSQTPDQSHYEYLHEKLEELEVRHASREQKLQSVVRDLLRQSRGRNKGDVVALREKLEEKNREIWYYKTEMDKILARVGEVEREVGENRRRRYSESD